MAEAMRHVRTELGADAMILSSRRVADGVEITAGLEADDTPPPPLQARPAAPQPAPTPLAHAPLAHAPQR